MALASIDVGELEVAEAHYRESLAIKPQPAIYNDLGFVLERQGMPDEAAEQYRKSLSLDPESPSANFNLAAYLARRGQLADAERHFRAAIAAEPSSPALTGLGFVLWQQGRVDEAIARLGDAIDADPTNAAAYDQLGSILVEQGKLDEAASTYRRLVRTRPSAAAHQELANVLTRMGRTDEAQKEMAAANAMAGAEGSAR